MLGVPARAKVVVLGGCIHTASMFCSVVYVVQHVSAMTVRVMLDSGHGALRWSVDDPQPAGRPVVWSLPFNAQSIINVLWIYDVLVVIQCCTCTGERPTRGVHFRCRCRIVRV